MKRKDLVAVALVLYDDLATWERDGITKTDIRHLNKNSLEGFINSVYDARRREMWRGDFEIWWKAVMRSSGVWE